MGTLLIDYNHDESKRITQFKLTGDIDVFSYMTCKSALEEKTSALIGGRILVDLSEVGFVASSGWAVLIGFSRISKDRRGSVVAVFGLQESVGRVYGNMCIETLLPVYPDLATAMQAPQLSTRDPWLCK